MKYQGFKKKLFWKVFSIFQVFKQFDIVGKKVDNFEFLLISIKPELLHVKFNILFKVLQYRYSFSLYWIRKNAMLNTRNTVQTINWKFLSWECFQASLSFSGQIVFFRRFLEKIPKFQLLFICHLHFTLKNWITFFQLCLY